MKKKLLSAVLAMALLLSMVCVPSPAFAATYAYTDRNGTRHDIALYGPSLASSYINAALDESWDWGIASISTATRVYALERDPIDKVDCSALAAVFVVYQSGKPKAVFTECSTLPTLPREEYLRASRNLNTVIVKEGDYQYSKRSDGLYSVMTLAGSGAVPCYEWETYNSKYYIQETVATGILIHSSPAGKKDKGTSTGCLVIASPNFSVFSSLTNVGTIRVSRGTVTTAKPANLNAERASVNTGKVSWDAVPGALGYIVHYKRDTDTTWKTDTDYDVRTGATSYNPYLINNIKYNFRVCAIGPKGSSAWSEVTYTHQADGAKLTGLAATKGADLTKVQLTWDLTPGADYYKVYFKRGNGTKEGWDTTNCTTNSFISLGNDTTQDYYVFTVYAMSSSGTEMARSSIAYNMKAALPGLTAARGADQTKVNLAWSAVSGASNYKVYYKRGDGTKEGWDTTACTSTAFTSTGNDTSQYYYVYVVYAMGSSGNELYRTAIVYNMK